MLKANTYLLSSLSLGVTYKKTQRKENGPMKAIFEEYGTVIIVAVAIVALIAIVTFLVGESGVIKDAFETVVNGFLNDTKYGSAG